MLERNEARGSVILDKDLFELVPESRGIVSINTIDVDALVLRQCLKDESSRLGPLHLPVVVQSPLMGSSSILVSWRRRPIASVKSVPHLLAREVLLHGHSPLVIGDDRDILGAWEVEEVESDMIGRD